MRSDWLNKEQKRRESWLDSSFRMRLLLPSGPEALLTLRV